MPRPSLLDHFSCLDDPRQLGKVLYPLPEIMLLVLCAALAGAEDFVETRLWGLKKVRFLRRMLPFRRGIPSHDTLNDVMNALDGDLFAAAFVSWVDGLRETEPGIVAPEVVAIDGKTPRRAHAGGHPLHMVSAWASRQRLVLGQEATDAKSNEISAIPLLLERLHLTGALVTIDAMGTQTKIAGTILTRGADYLLALKDNQKSLATEVALFFDAHEQRGPAHVTTDADHGRIETRRHWVSHDVGWLNGDRRAPGEPRFPGLKAIAMVEACVERDGKTTTSRRYFLSSLAPDPALLARAVRAHWGIENRLHWVLDVVFHDDLMRLRTGNGPKNMATIKHMAMNLIRAAPGKDSLKSKRKAAAWDQDYLKAIITQAAK
jgi:predicted transposase YbfD/YdcC